MRNIRNWKNFTFVNESKLNVFGSDSGIHTIFGQTLKHDQIHQNFKQNKTFDKYLRTKYFRSAFVYPNREKTATEEWLWEKGIRWNVKEH